MNMEKINYKEETANWIMNEGPMDMADILVDVLESDAFDGNSYYDKLYYADNLVKELRKYMFYVINESNNEDEVFQFDKPDEAVDKADTIWSHLTNGERLNRNLVVAFGTPTHEEFENGYLPEEGYYTYHKYEC